MMHFLHIRELLSQKQIKLINSPFYLDENNSCVPQRVLIPDDDKLGFYEKGDIIATLSYFQGSLHIKSCVAAR